MRPDKMESTFKNTADAHMQDVRKTQSNLRLAVGDHGLPDTIALLADAVQTQDDYGLSEVRRVLDTRAAAIRALGEVMR